MDFIFEHPFWKCQILGNLKNPGESSKGTKDRMLGELLDVPVMIWPQLCPLCAPAMHFAVVPVILGYRNKIKLKCYKNNNPEPESQTNCESIFLYNENQI